MKIHLYHHKLCLFGSWYQKRKLKKLNMLSSVSIGRKPIFFVDFCEFLSKFNLFYDVIAITVTISKFFMPFCLLYGKVLLCQISYQKHIPIRIYPVGAHWAPARGFTRPKKPGVATIFYRIIWDMSEFSWFWNFDSRARQSI